MTFRLATASVDHIISPPGHQYVIKACRSSSKASPFYYFLIFIWFCVLAICFRTQQTRDTAHVLVQCWPIVCDAGPTLNQHLGNVPCLLGILGCWSFCELGSHYNTLVLSHLDNCSSIWGCSGVTKIK